MRSDRGDRWTAPLPRRRGRAATRPTGALIALLLGVLIAGRAQAEVAVEASVDTTDVLMGEAFTLTISIDGAQSVSPPALNDLDGFTATYLGPSTQVSFVNGHMSASVSHRYRVTATRSGDLQLGPFTVQVQGQQYQTKPITMRIGANAGAQRARAAASNGQGLRLVVEPEKEEVYVGERVDLTLTLYIGNVRIRDLQYPVIAADGVTLDKFAKPEEGNGILDGQRYQTLTLRTTMTPIRPGSVDLNASMSMNVLTARRGMDPLFDQFFGGGDTKEADVRADPVHLTVLPLPEQGKPADFAGAVGTFDFTLTAKPTTLEVGDPITLRMQISGTGNLATLSAPPVPVGDRFRAYDAQPAKGEDGGDRRVFEQVVIPKVADITALPAVRFSFFDPDTRAYRTVTQGPIPLVVQASHAAKPEVVDAGQSASEAAQPRPQPVGRDIVYIKDAPGALEPRGPHLYQRAWFLLLQVVPVALFGALWMYARRRDRLAADPRLVRFRQAGRVARRSLAALGRGETVDARFYDELSAALSSYLAAKLDLPPGGVDRDRVLARLHHDGARSDVRERIGDFFQLVEHARYAPSRGGAAARTNALELATAIVDRLERERRLARNLAAGIALALCCGAWVGAARAGDTAPQTAFFQGNQAYAAGRYADALRAYESVRDAGQDSGALEFNLGNAFFKDNQLAQAIASYSRAGRLLPRDPDVQANLSYALETAHIAEEPTPLWKRFVFPFAERATGSELAIAASVCWWAVWLLLAAHVLVPALRTGVRRATWVAAALYLIIAGSLGIRLADTELRDVAIVTASGGTSVRFEPSATGTEHFPAAPGTRLDVTEAGDDWLQVRRADGLRGWVARKDVERLD